VHQRTQLQLDVRKLGRLEGLGSNLGLFTRTMNTLSLDIARQN
jgi:hypothetical protein